MTETGEGSVKWLPKSPKLHGSHNWSSPGCRWASLKGKENVQGCNSYKISSANEKWKEGRISPEQEAEELEDPEEDEPISKFSGSLFDTSSTIRDQRNAGVPFQDKQKAAPKVKPSLELSNKRPVPAAASSNFPKDGNRRFSKETKEQIPRTADGTAPPLKDALISEPSMPDSGPLPSSKSGCSQTANHVIMIPRIILTRPSTSDEDADQLTQDPDDSEPEETDNTESHLYSDCINHAFYPP